MRHTSIMSETSPYNSLSVFPLSSLRLAVSAIPLLAFTSKYTVSVRLCPSTTKQLSNARTSVSRNRDHVYVRAGLRECVRVCTSGGLMGPTNDYWPADLGGTRARATYIVTYACVYERHDLFALADPSH